MTSKEVKNLCTLEENKPEYKFSPKITQEFKEHILKLEATIESGGQNNSNPSGNSKQANTKDSKDKNYQHNRIAHSSKASALFWSESCI